MINLKSPVLSRRNSKNLSPSPVLSASSLSPKSFYSSPDYNSNLSSNMEECPEVKGVSPALSSDVSIFSFNIQDDSEGNTPMLTPVLTPRSASARPLVKCQELRYFFSICSSTVQVLAISLTTKLQFPV